MEITKTIRINSLLDIYGSLLTAHQQEVMEEYYQDDLSLSELASNHSVSRNAIFTLLKKGEASLEKYEANLHLLEKREKILKVLNSAKQADLTKKITKIMNEEE